MYDIFILLFLLVLSGLFSGSETALTTITMIRVETLVREKRAGAKALYCLKTNTSRMLITLLIGNNLVNIGASAFATVVATQWFGSFGPGVAVGVLTLFILVFGEVMPKSLASRHYKPISLLAAPVLLFLMRLLWPLVLILERLTDWFHGLIKADVDPTVTESELISMAGYGEEEGTINSSERVMIERVFAFGDLTAEDVMSHRHQIFSLDSNLTVEQALPPLLSQTFSRVPVFHERRDEIIGVVYVRALFEKMHNGETTAKLSEICNKPLFVVANQLIKKVLTLMRSEHHHLAIVVNEFGSIQGVITLEDILEELVGDIHDEGDKLMNCVDEKGNPAPCVIEVEKGLLMIDGDQEVRQIEDSFNVELSGKPTDSVNRWVLSHAKEIPAVGQEYIIDSLGIKIERASNRKIYQISVRQLDFPDNKLVDYITTDNSHEVLGEGVIEDVKH